MTDEVNADETPGQAAHQKTIQIPLGHAWPGWRNAWPSLLIGLLLGPSALYLGIYGHLSERRIQIDDSSNPIQWAERAFTVAVGFAGTWYLVKNVILIWIVKTALEVQGAHVHISKRFWLFNTTTSISIARIDRIDAYLGSGEMSAAGAYLCVVPTNQTSDQPTRIPTATLSMAQNVSRQLNLAMGKTIDAQDTEKPSQ